MKVLHVTRTFHPAFGGMEDAIKNLALHQRREGMDVQILTLDRPAGSHMAPLPEQATVSGIPVRRVPWRGSSRYPLAPAALRHLNGADLLHVHGIDSFFDMLALTRPLHRRPMVVSTHGGFFHTNFMRKAKQAWFHTLTRLSIAAYDGIIASSENDAKQFARLRPRLLQTIENGVDVHRWAGCGAATPTKHMIYFGRFASHKRISALFELLRALRLEDPAWSLTVAGSPADVSENDLRQQAADQGAAVRIEIRPNTATLARLIGQAGYYACASSYEGFGIAAVEAISAGLIPVLSDIPPFAKLIGGRDEALLFEPDQPAASALQLIRLHQYLSPRWTDVRQNLMGVAAAYDWTNVEAEHSAFYERVMRQNAVAHA